MITDEISIPTTKEIEADGFITPQSALERADLNRAKPVSECVYPKCEECDKYHGHYCTVPMVVSKQNYIIINDKIDDLMKRVLDLENLVTEEIIGSKDAIRIDHDGWHKQVVAGEEVWCPDGAHIEVHEGIKYIVEDKPNDKPNLTRSDYFRENSR